MKRLGLAFFAALTALATLAPAAHAQTREDARQVRQRGRIQAGVAQGDLTAAERARLNAGQARVQGMENRAQADGRVTNREAARIENAQDVQSARINRLRNNNRTR